MKKGCNKTKKKFEQISIKREGKKKGLILNSDEQPTSVFVIRLDKGKRSRQIYTFCIEGLLD